MLFFFIPGTVAHSGSGQNCLHFTVLLGLRLGRLLCRHNGQIDSYTQQGIRFLRLTLNAPLIRLWPATSQWRYARLAEITPYERFFQLNKKAQLTQGLRATAPSFQDGRQPPSLSRHDWCHNKHNEFGYTIYIFTYKTRSTIGMSCRHARLCPLITDHILTSQARAYRSRVN